MHPADGDYDWTREPWFLSKNREEDVWGARYEREELERALAVLSERYPPAFCRHYLETVSKSGFVEGGSEKELRRHRQQRGFAQMLLDLYGRWGVSMPMLALGADLAEVVPLGPDRAWLDRFRNPHEIFGVEFELELWANCIRSGIPISRVPEGTTKTPDFVLRWSSVEVAVEAKTLATSEQDRVPYDAFIFIHPWDALPPDRAFHVEVAPEVRALVRDRDGREKYRSMIYAALAAIEADRARVEGLGFPIGEHVVPGAGMNVIRLREPETPVGVRSYDAAEPMTEEEQAQRALSTVRNAAEKFRVWPDRRGRVGIVVIDVPRDYQPEALFAAVAEDVERDTDAYRWTDAVLCRSTQMHVPEDRNPALAYQYFLTYTIRLPWCMLLEHQLAEFARPLLGSPHRLTMPMRRRGEPDPRQSAAIEMKTYVRALQFAKKVKPAPSGDR
jgi:hypothetical protein